MIALSEPPATGSQEEARTAAMRVCEMIRENHLSVYDPKELSGTIPPRVGDEDTKETLARVVADHPIRRAQRQRAEERQRRAVEEADRRC